MPEIRRISFRKKYELEIKVYAENLGKVQSLLNINKNSYFIEEFDNPKIKNVVVTSVNIAQAVIIRNLIKNVIIYE